MTCACLYTMSIIISSNRSVLVIVIIDYKRWQYTQLVVSQ